MAGIRAFEQENSCLAQKKFLDSVEALDTVSSISQKNYIGEAADKLSEVFRPKFVEVMRIWELFIQDLLKEALEKIFAQIPRKEDNVHLQKLVEKSLVHHASFSEQSDVRFVNEVRRKGAAKMSRSNPDLWTSHVDSYKAHLSEKIAQVVPTFEASHGINFLVAEITGVVGSSLSDFMLDMNEKRINISFYYTKRMSRRMGRFDFTLTSSTKLDCLLKLYYGSYCLLTENNPDCLEGFSDLSFASDLRSFGYISGPFLCNLYKNVCEYTTKTWIYPDTYCNLLELLKMLALKLPSAISSFTYQHLDFHIWDD